MKNIALSKNFSIKIILIILLVGSISGIAYYLLKHQPYSQACTLEAQICPDGTSVGRTGPNCEFAPCPAPSTEFDSITDWQTYTNNQLAYQIQYPPNYFIKVEDVNNLPSLKISNNSDFEKNEFALVITVEPLENHPNFQASTNPLIIEVLNRIGYQTLSSKWGKYIGGAFLGDPPIGYYEISFSSKSKKIKSILITARIHRIDEMSKSEGGTENEISIKAQEIISTFKFLDTPVNFTSERSDGPTPNGGDYSVAYFKDEDGNPVNKEVASSVEIVEYDKNGNEIFRTFGNLK